MVTTGPWLLYGANGYTGELVARLAVARGHRPVLAGRRADEVCALADELRLERRLFALDEPQRIDAALQGMTAVLHCAGPFSRTSQPMAEACLRTATHYLDITGELAVFEALATRDAEARAAGVMLLPGSGFDVVPSDCLALHLKARLPQARRLALAYGGMGRLSRGTATTAIESLGAPCYVRRNGALVPSPPAPSTRRIDFGEGPRSALLLPLGDLTTAWHTTGIPEIDLYFAPTASLRALIHASRWFAPLVGSSPVRRFLTARVRAGAAGPTERERQHGHSFVWGEVADARGRTATARIDAPDGYTFTAQAAVATIERVLGGAAPSGFQTPARAYGADFVLSLDGVTRTDLD